MGAGFSENLKKIRKERNLSQEELAEMLEVSRQAVSKWEAGKGYPEVEKLLEISGKLDVSLDDLMGTGKSTGRSRQDGRITIISPHENVIVTCYKVEPVPLGTRYMKKEDSPHFALSAVGMEAHPFWGQPKTFLGWYADEEQAGREIAEIRDALARGDAQYELKYSVRAERRGLRMKIVDERKAEL